MGLLLARNLVQKGRRTVILDRGQPGHEASWAAAGMVPNPPGNLTDPMNPLLHRSLELFPELEKTLSVDGSQTIGWNPSPWLMIAWTEDQAEVLERECAFRKTEQQKVELLQGKDIQRAEPGLTGRLEAALMFPGASLDPRALCSALVTAVEKLGVEIRRHEPALGLARVKNGQFCVETPTGKINTPNVVLAAGAWSGLPRGMSLEIPVRPQRGQIISLSSNGVDLRHVILDTNSFPYLVPRSNGQIIVGATRESTGFDKGLTREGMAWLKDASGRIVPKLSNAKIKEKWMGLRPVSVDGLPLIGAGPENGLFIMTGHGANGIAPAPASAEALASLVCGEVPLVDLSLLDPMRFSKVGLLS